MRLPTTRGMTPTTETRAQEQAARDGGQPGNEDPFVSFYHDVPRRLAEEAMSRARASLAESCERSEGTSTSSARAVMSTSPKPACSDDGLYDGGADR